MHIIISPAKKMNEDEGGLSCQGLPVFLPKTQQILSRLQEMSYEELKKLWKCSDKLTSVNIERLQKMDLQRAYTPAIFAYEGIQYQHMAPNVFTEDALLYIQKYLRILSGFYGILKPFDAVCPYRLEMQAKLTIDDFSHLYDFWGDCIACAIYEETDCILNLASTEYSKCISAHLPQGKQFITCVFGEKKGEKIIEKGTVCKMLRGEMVRYLAENNITLPQDVKAFSCMGYAFAEAYSSDDSYVFLKKEEISED